MGRDHIEEYLMVGKGDKQRPRDRKKWEKGWNLAFGKKKKKDKK